MATTSVHEGFKNDAFRTALAAALAGRPAALEDLLARYGGAHDGKPNLRLAAAFGAELTDVAGPVTALLTRLSAEDAAPDMPRVFLPIAAAHGWVARLRGKHDVAAAWAALGQLAGDERPPVRVGTLDALNGYAARDGGAAALLNAACDWLEMEDREVCFSASALAVEAFADRRVISTSGSGIGLLDYLSRAIAAVADAPRSAERSEGRRRLLQSLPKTMAAAVMALSAGDRGANWLEVECTDARHPDLRAVLSDTVVRLSTRKEEVLSESVAERLRAALKGSAKPPRDPSRIRKGTGRGKVSRRMR